MSNSREEILLVLKWAAHEQIVIMFWYGMLTFDGFFVAAHDLLQEHRLYPFSVVDSELYYIYMDLTHMYMLPLGKVL